MIDSMADRWFNMKAVAGDQFNNNHRIGTYSTHCTSDLEARTWRQRGAGAAAGAAAAVAGTGAAAGAEAAGVM